MMLRFLYCIPFFFAAFIPASDGQSLFPVKVHKKWGLIDSAGKVVVPARYEAIGDFKAFQLAVMQLNGRVGLLDQAGNTVLPARYEDIKVLDANLMAVMQQGIWQVINRSGTVILDRGYKRVQVLRSGYLAFLQEDYWGIVRSDGRLISQPIYEDIESVSESFFLTSRSGRLGLLRTDGTTVLDNRAGEIRLLSDSLIFFRESGSWGAIDAEGRPLIPARYNSYRMLGDGFIRLLTSETSYIYSISCGRLLSEADFDDYFPYSDHYIIVKKDRRLGLFDRCGTQILSPRYQEIQAFAPGKFRVKEAGKWGIVEWGDHLLLPPSYSYIAPLKFGVSIVRGTNGQGLINAAGEVLASTRFDSIEVSNNVARAYASAEAGNALTVLRFDDRGRLLENGQFNRHFSIQIAGRSTDGQPPTSSASVYQLEDFEWYYSPEQDRWGLRKLTDGRVQIEPIFTSIQVEPSLGLTVVSIEKPHRAEFERTTFRFDRVYGLVLNDLGRLVTDLDFLDIRLPDWKAGRPLARCVFSDGRHGLLDRNGRLERRDLTFIGGFNNGLARVSFSGQLTGTLKAENSLGRISAYLDGLLAPSTMVDYTQYDQHFQQSAQLICEGCNWGYMNEAGDVIVKPKYTFAQDFSNGVGLVSCSGKWGMVDQQGRERISCNYDGIELLSNTDNRMVRLYVEEPKYGLIDTLGQLRVDAIYEEIGSFSEGRLAVRRGGLWGFVDANGNERVPCQFEEVSEFHEGLAAVRKGRYWGFIDLQGTIVIDYIYRRAGNFSNGRAWVYDGTKTGFIDSYNQFVIPPQYDRAFDFEAGIARVVVDGQFGLIDTAGRVILRPRYNEIRTFNDHGLAVVSLGNKNIRYGLIDRQGSLIGRTSFREIGPFQEGLAVVKDKEGYGFINTAGRTVIPLIYSRAQGFREGLAVVQKDGRCGYVDRRGTLVIPCSYSHCQDFSGGRAVVYRGIRNAGIVDRSGRHLVEPSLDRLLGFREGRGLMRDQQDRFYYITEQTGLYDGYYEKAEDFQHGVALVRIDGKWGIINQKGIEIIPPKYDRIEGFQDGYAKVRIKGLTGLSNLDGELLVQPSYEYISYMGAGLFRVEQGDQVGYFNSEGNWVWNLSN